MPAPKKPRKKSAKKVQKKTMSEARFFLISGAIFLFIIIGTLFFFRKKINFYWSLYFHKTEHKLLSNSAKETAKINRILGENADKVFGIDISHYQERDEIKWDSLSLGNRTIPIKFVVMRATMGNKSADKNFQFFWKSAHENGLIRGAYHFYRPDEDPVIQANNFLSTIKLESGDLRPVLDIEHPPIRLKREDFIKNLKIWLDIVEKKYGVKPILYTYSFYYKDFLTEDFAKYPLWIANYNDVENPAPRLDWKIWQFSESGIVHGISTKVDVNFYDGSLGDFEDFLLE